MNGFTLRHLPPVLLASIILLSVVAAIMVKLLALNGGNFSFALVDPYIHFALAENLLQGHYGINANENAAPSSSILWPFLVAPLMLLAHGDYAVLVLNCLLSIATLVIAGRLFDQMMAVDARKKWFAMSIMLVCFMLWSNMVGLIFTGMEHCLHVLLTILILHGLIVEAESKALPGFLLMAILLAPLVRYEAAALSGIALLYLFWRGYRQAALLVGVGLALTVGGFSVFLLSMGLNFLPASVTAKSVTMGADGIVQGILWNMLDQVLNFTGAWLYFLCAGLIYGVWKQRVDPLVRPVIVVVIGMLLMHFFAGRSGWYGRYDIYATVVAVMMFLYAYRDAFSAYLQRASVKAILARSVLTTLILYLPFLYILLTVPYASNNIYQQQYQMSRFVSEFYQKPVGVNDLGWVAFNSSQFVLDYGGLASFDVQKLRHLQEQKGGKRAPALGFWSTLGGAPSTTLVDEWMDELAERKGVKLVMIYDNWFNHVPENWVKVGELELSPGRPVIVVPNRTVSFYARDTSEAAKVKQLLADFSMSMPTGSQVNLL